MVEHGRTLTPSMPDYFKRTKKCSKQGMAADGFQSVSGKPFRLIDMWQMSADVAQRRQADSGVPVLIDTIFSSYTLLTGFLQMRTDEENVRRLEATGPTQMMRLIRLARRGNAHKTKAPAEGTILRMRCCSKYSDMFSQFESGGAQKRSRVRDDEDSADD
ncbi:hypothetical protein Tco_0661069 [Tanacetum coccineum]